jgi:hypothetical protein
MLRSRAITQRCTSNTYSSVVPGISDWTIGQEYRRIVENAPLGRVNVHNHSGRTVTSSTGGRVYVSRTLLG